MVHDICSVSSPHAKPALEFECTRRDSHTSIYLSTHTRTHDYFQKKTVSRAESVCQRGSGTVALCTCCGGTEGAACVWEQGDGAACVFGEKEGATEPGRPFPCSIRICNFPSDSPFNSPFNFLFNSPLNSAAPACSLRICNSPFDPPLPSAGTPFALVCCSVLLRVAVWCSVMPRVAVCCSVLPSVAVCCSVL